MSTLFGQVWFWSLLAFLIGALLTWVLLVRPAQQRVQQLEQPSGERSRRVADGHDDRDDAASVPEPQWPGDSSAGSASGAGGTVAEHPPVRWMERDSLPPRPGGYESDVDAQPYQGYQEFEQYEQQYEQSGAAQPAPYAHTDQDARYEQFDSVEQLTADDFDQPSVPAGEQTEYYDPRGYTETGQASYRGTSLNPQVDDYAQEDYAQERVEVSEQPAAPTSQVGGLFEPIQPVETAESYEAYDFDDGSTATEVAEPQHPPAEEPEPERQAPGGLPKRERGATNRIRGGFEPPRPIQPSVRTVARRSPGPEPSSGSLFEPAGEQSDAGEDQGGAYYPPPARDHGQAAGAVPAGPFGPGSAMPLAGGGRPSPEFTVKASVTALRYCTSDSPQFPRMVAEVWFVGVDDAERVGFRPLN